MKAYFYCFIIILLAFTSCTNLDNETTSVSENKIDSLMSVMTIEEKIGQLNLYNSNWDFTGPVPENENAQERADNIRNGKVTGMLNILTVEAIREAQKMAVEESRLGIPMVFGYDVVHGYRTMLPIPLGQASSWDIEVARKGNVLAAKEASASGLNWAFAPMIDVSRDGRWGRIMESAGEDPYLASVMARGWVEGFQGDDLSSQETVAACAKHFAAYGYAESGRDYNTTDISQQTLYNVVLPPFKEAVDAGVISLMNGFNDLNGIPVTASKKLQRDILKGDWGFDGFVVSDFNSVTELIAHGYSKNNADAALAAFEAGSDVEMESRNYEKYLKELITSGQTDIKLLDEAVRRVLTAKHKLGLFEDPYRYLDTDREKTQLLTKENLEVSRDVARKSIVLLKNEDKLLPLSKDVKSIAVIGQLAGSKDVPLGSWRAQAIENSGVSLLEGIQNAVSSQTNVRFSQGYALVDTTARRNFVFELTMADPTDRSGFATAISLAKSSDVVVMAMGEDCFQTGEGRSQVDISLKGNQLELFDEIIKVNKNVVVVLMNGRPLAIPELYGTAPAIVETWFGGSEAGNATADVIFGDYNPTGKLPVSFPYHSGQEPLYYSRKNTGRPVTNDFDAGLVFWSHYTDSPNEALIPFGYGLSYAEFTYDKLEVKTESGSVLVSTTVSNGSAVKGTETVQVYIWDKVASLVQPIKRLVDFKKVEIDANQSQIIEFELNTADLGFYNQKGEFVTEDGEYIIMVGGNSAEVIESSVNVAF